MIEIVDLKQTFGTNEVLKGVSLSVDKGDIYGIIGLSGEGKSTFVRCLNRLDEPTSGEIYVHNANILTLKGKDLRKHRQNCAMIFQDFNLIDQKTVYQNVEQALLIQGKRDKAKIDGLLDRVGMLAYRDYYPSQISGGMKQRVAIARALATDPEVLLCDECTSALDPKTSCQILDLIKELRDTLDLTVLIIAHQMSVIERVCNKVAILSGGKIAECGLLEDIFRHPQSNAGKELIYSNRLHREVSDHRGLRLVFDGSPDEPIITLLIEECNVLVSIVMAESRVINGKVYGQVIIKLPYYEEDIDKVKAFLAKHGVQTEEVDYVAEIG